MEHALGNKDWATRRRGVNRDGSAGYPYRRSDARRVSASDRSHRSIPMATPSHHAGVLLLAALVLTAENSEEDTKRTPA